jgi:hypothetical protein
MTNKTVVKLFIMTPICAGVGYVLVSGLMILGGIFK